MNKKASNPAKEIRFRSLFENGPEIILYQDENSVILDANPAFLKLVGEPLENVLNRDYNEFLPPAVRPLYRKNLKKAFTGKSVRFDLCTSQGDSTPRHWDVIKIPVLENNKVLGVHMVARDITEKVLAQEEILKKNKDLQQFTYVVSHNLRSPLSNALGLLDLLEALEPGSADFRASQAHLKTSLLQLDLVVKDMNSILSIRDKESLVKTEKVPLLGVVKKVIENFEEGLKDSGGTVKVAIPEDFKVTANKAFLYSIFYNLLSNAIKFRCEERPLLVNLTAVSKEDHKEICFTDNGLGIDLKKAGANMFKLYKRFHPQHPGRGQGLYLVRAHVESIGGTIKVISQPNLGTTFKIFLP